MRTIKVDLVGHEDRKKKALKLVKKAKANIVKSELIKTDDGGDFFHLAFEMSERRFRKIADKFVSIGDYEVTI